LSIVSSHPQTLNDPPFLVGSSFGFFHPSSMLATVVPVPVYHSAHAEAGFKARAETSTKEEEVVREEGVEEKSSLRSDAVSSSVSSEATEVGAKKEAETGGSMDTKDDVSKPPATYSPNTVIMFDWDDTLLASSFLSARGYRVDCVESPAAVGDSSDAAQLRAQEQCVVALLTLALSYGTVNVVTNAEVGWVELSAQKFMPSVLPLLSKITVLSARSTFEPAYPEAPLKWKYYAFHDRLRSAFGDSCMDSRAAEADIAMQHIAHEMKRNIVSFGDSHVEREAIRAVTRGVLGWRCKSVKFAERPTVEQLRRQLELVTNCFHYIATHPADLDLQLTVTLHAAPPTSPPPASA